MATKPVVVKILGDAKGLGKSLDEAEGKLGKFSGFVEGLGGKLKAAALGAGAAVGGALAVGLANAINVDAANDKLAAQLGLTEQEAKEYGRIAGDLYGKGLGEGIEEVNEALRYVSQNFGEHLDEAGNSLDVTTEKTLNLVKAFDEDLSMATQAVGTMLRAGLVKDAEEAFDILTVGMQGPANKAGDLLETFQEYSTMFRDIGISGADAVGLMNQALEAGARDADKVADALKEFAIRAQDGSATTAEGFRMIGLNAEEMSAKVAQGGPAAREALDAVLDGLQNMDDPLQRNLAAVALFGTQAEDLGDALYSMDLDSAATSLGDYAGAAERMGDTLNDNAATKIESFKRRALQGLTEFVGNVAIPAFERLWPKVEPVIEALSEGFTNLQGYVQPVIQWLTEAWDEVVNFIDESGIDFQGIFDKIGSTLESWADTAKSAFGAVQAVFQTVVNVLRDLWDRFGADLVARLQGHINGVVNMVQGLFGVLKGIFDLIKAVLTGDWSAAWEAIKTILSGAWQFILGLVQTSWNTLLAMFQACLAILSAVWSFAWNALKTLVGDIWNGIVSAASTGITAVVDLVKGVPGKLGELAQSFIDAGAGLGSSILSGVKDAITGAADFAGDVASAIVDAFKSAWNTFADTVNDLIPNSIGLGPASIDLPNNPIPTFRAMGGPASGWTVVGERGPELVHLPKGSEVVPNHATGAVGATVNVYVQSNASPADIGREVAWVLRTSGR